MLLHYLSSVQHVYTASLATLLGLFAVLPTFALQGSMPEAVKINLMYGRTCKKLGIKAPYMKDKEFKTTLYISSITHFLQPMKCSLLCVSFPSCSVVG